MTTRPLLAVVVAALCACGGARPTGHGAVADAAPSATPDAGATALSLEQDYPRLAERTADMLVALAEALAGAGDCATIAEHAHAVIDQNAEVRAAAALAEDDGHGRDLDAALEAHAARIATATARMKPNLDRCGADPAFAAAVTAFDPRPRPRPRAKP